MVTILSSWLLMRRRTVEMIPQQVVMKHLIPKDPKKVDDPHLKNDNL